MQTMDEWRKKEELRDTECMFIHARAVLGETNECVLKNKYLSNEQKMELRNHVWNASMQIINALEYLERELSKQNDTKNAL